MTPHQTIERIIKPPRIRSTVAVFAFAMLSLSGCGGMMLEVGVSPRGGSLGDENAADAGQPTLQEVGRTSAFDEREIRVRMASVLLSEGMMGSIGLSRWTTAVRADPSESMTVYAFGGQFIGLHQLAGPLALTTGFGSEFSRASLSLDEQDWSGWGIAFPVSGGVGFFVGSAFVRAQAEYSLIRIRGGEYGFFETGECLAGTFPGGCYRRDIVADSGLRGKLDRFRYVVSVGIGFP